MLDRCGRPLAGRRWLLFQSSLPWLLFWYVGDVVHNVQAQVELGHGVNQLDRELGQSHASAGVAHDLGDEASATTISMVMTRSWVFKKNTPTKCSANMFLLKVDHVDSHGGR